MNPTYINNKNLIKHFKLSQPKLLINKIENQDKEKEKEKEKDDIINIREYNKDLSFDIKTLLPSMNNTILKNNNYTYKLSHILNSDNINRKTNKTIHLCIFNIIENEKTDPSILYLLNKNEETNILYFPHFNTKENIFDEANIKINEIFKNWDNKAQYKGFIETNNNIYVFYQQIYPYVLEKIEYKDLWWWTTIFELVNIKKVLNFFIDRTVYSIFYKNPLLLSLFDNNNNKISIPYVGYVGGYYTYISFIAAFGIPKQIPTNNLGPYYYFNDYYGAGRWSIWSPDRKEKIINNEIITVKDTGIYKEGGIARFIFFGNNIKYFLNRDTDPEDDSQISQNLAKEYDFFKETLKVRDVSAKWADNHDLAYIGSFLTKQGKFNSRRFIIQFAARDYNQQLCLSYHSVDTTEFSKITDETEKKNLSYIYKDYKIK